MDKLKPTYILSNVKKLIEKGSIIPNVKIIRFANDIGFSETEVYDEILKLERNNFYKSTTELFNHKIWQDVYKKKIKDLPIYIKFQVVNNQFLLRSFKIDKNA